MVILNNLFVEIEGHVLLKSLSCSLVPGRITTFLGKSGAGKTTLLKTIAGLMPADGSISIDGTPMTQLSAYQRACYVGFVFQEFNLFPHQTVLTQCLDPQVVHGKAYEQAQSRAKEILKSLDIDSFGEKYPRELSGGQQQRVAIVRALCLDPRVLLLDEPTASLDPSNTEILVEILNKLASKGMTIALSTHDMHFARQIVDYAYYLSEGSIIERCEGAAMLNQCPLMLQSVYGTASFFSMR